jgi:thioredoxin 2
MNSARRHIVCPHCDAVNRVPPGKAAKDGKCGRCKALLFVGAPAAVSAASFTTHIQRNDIPVVVDFWAAWCGPCRLVSPVVESFGEKHSDRIGVAKVNTDENQQLAMRYSIFSIPTLIVFQNGREAARLVGYMPQEVMEERLSQFLT